LKKQENFLTYVPRHNKLFKWEQDEEGRVFIFQEHKGIANTIAQKFFGRPKVSRIELQGMGSFIWLAMDGKKTVYDIGKEVKAKFGDDAEPLYERLSVYVKQLHNMHYVVYEQKIKKDE